MGVRHMTGTPWHVERLTREEGDDRRNRRHCIHYREGTCGIYGERCRGTAHCHYYESKSISVKHKKHQRNKQLKEINEPPKQKKSYAILEYVRQFPKGMRVLHSSFGIGTVIRVSEERIVIDFDMIGEKKLAVDICIKKNLLQRIDRDALD